MSTDTHERKHMDIDPGSIRESPTYNLPQEESIQNSRERLHHTACKIEYQILHPSTLQNIALLHSTELYNTRARRITQLESLVNTINTINHSIGRTHRWRACNKFIKHVNKRMNKGSISTDKTWKQTKHNKKHIWKIEGQKSGVCGSRYIECSHTGGVIG